MSMPMDVVLAQTKMKQELNSEYGKMVQKESTTRYYGLKLHKEKDSDIISCLDQQENKQAFIKGVIRHWIYKARYNQ